MLDFGISSPAFRSDFLERKAALFRAVIKEPEDASSDLAMSLCASDHTDGRVNVFLNGAPLPYDMFTETYQDISDVRRRISIAQIEAFLEKGATIAVNRIDRQSPYVRHICDQIQAFAREAATANCYAAYSGNGSFGAHWDTHDVIALQLAGKKRWRVWMPTHCLPAPGQGSRNKSRDPHAAPVMELVLEPGDALYIPRGWWHEATPIPHYKTIHLAIGLHASTVADYLSWLASNVLIDHEQLRQGFSRASQSTDDINSALNLALSISVDRENIAAYTTLHEIMLSPAQRKFSNELSR